ncbi:hypothetical protein QBC43DRAFT_321123 [Cladorrhinum sp. PSN259]|nr:hypothetical protein QBC43DRAFT_321123 [Cladorrhinum sp. PSN259]
MASTNGDDVNAGQINGHANGSGNGAATPPDRKPRPVITVFSGGTAANSLVDVFNRIVKPRKGRLNYVIPISDNGGSSSELIRFVGGPSVGDIRSRLVRLIPKGDEEMAALRQFFEHRLTNVDPNKARMEWLDIIESRSVRWAFISSPKKELIRSVLNTLNLEIVKRTRPNNVYNFSGASIGNMFLTGARLFSGSFESAIYLLSMVCSIPPWVAVLPAIRSDHHTYHISAELMDGSMLTGQSNISHPSAPSALPDDDTEEDHSHLPGSLPTLHQQNIAFSKDEEDDLPARIRRLFYINLYGHELVPKPNSKVVEALKSSTTVIYSIGSLYTSIIPSLVFPAVGEQLESEGGGIKHKILILNSKLDRETGPVQVPRKERMTAKDFVMAIGRACVESREKDLKESSGGEGKSRVGDESVLRRFVTHLVYLEGREGEEAEDDDDNMMPKVDVEELEGRLGIKCLGVKGVEMKNGKGWRYDEKGLREVLEAIVDS